MDANHLTGHECRREGVALTPMMKTAASSAAECLSLVESAPLFSEQRPLGSKRNVVTVEVDSPGHGVLNS
jgi:hypothetical protein